MISILFIVLLRVIKLRNTDNLYRAIITGLPLLLPCSFDRIYIYNIYRNTHIFVCVPSSLNFLPATKPTPLLHKHKSYLHF